MLLAYDNLPRVESSRGFKPVLSEVSHKNQHVWPWCEWLFSKGGSIKHWKSSRPKGEHCVTLPEGDGWGRGLGRASPFSCECLRLRVGGPAFRLTSTGKSPQPLAAARFLTKLNQRKKNMGLMKSRRLHTYCFHTF